MWLKEDKLATKQLALLGERERERLEYIIIKI